MGIANNQGGRAKWTNHHVKFRDDGENINHYNQGKWAGIVGKVRADMEMYAK
jgi:hypothetical protein